MQLNKETNENPRESLYYIQDFYSCIMMIIYICMYVRWYSSYLKERFNASN